jgi:ketosteroid isomerase-like protein
MSPGGDVLTGAAAIAKRYASDAAHFATGSTSKLEILQAQSGPMAFWTGTQHAEVKSKGKDGAVPMALRVTEVFRLEDGGWKLIHRHADLGKPKS